MAIPLETSFLNAYRNLHLENAKAIVHMDGANLKQGGVYSGSLSSLSRTTEEKAANNQARTELLKALGRAFNIDGMHEDAGKVTFTKAFMDRLEKILGSDFKRGDFKLNSEGEVVSGRPLTMRRIEAIVKKADLVGTGNFTYSAYKQKMDVILKDMGLEKMTPEQLQNYEGKNRAVVRYVGMIMQTLDFLRNEADSSIRLTDEYTFERSTAEMEDDYNEADFNASYTKPKFEYFDANRGEYVSLTKTDDYQIYLAQRTGSVLHLENSDFKPSNPDSITKLNKYAGDTYKSLVKNFADNYLVAKERKCTKEFMDFLQQGGICTEDKIRKQVDFANTHFAENNGDPLSAEEIAELNRIADGVADKGKPVSPQNLIIDAIGRQNVESDEWADYAEGVKKELVGKFTIIVTEAVEQGEGYRFEPVMDGGKQVTRLITAEDIDNLGPACLHVLFNGEE